MLFQDKHNCHAYFINECTERLSKALKVAQLINAQGRDLKSGPKVHVLSRGA